MVKHLLNLFGALFLIFFGFMSILPYAKSSRSSMSDELLKELRINGVAYGTVVLGVIVAYASIFGLVRKRSKSRE
jgi:hypothetical protein